MDDGEGGWVDLSGCMEKVGGWEEEGFLFTWLASCVRQFQLIRESSSSAVGSEMREYWMPMFWTPPRLICKWVDGGRWVGGWRRRRRFE